MGATLLDRPSMAILKEQNPSVTTLPSPVAEIRYPVHRPHHVVLIPGDGIGPEVAEAAVRAVEATGISVEWERIELNAKTIAEYGGVLRIQSLMRSAFSAWR
jgi:Isocitrate/isopropylmalate dehydrogenase